MIKKVITSTGIFAILLTLMVLGNSTQGNNLSLNNSCQFYEITTIGAEETDLIVNGLRYCDGPASVKQEKTAPLIKTLTALSPEEKENAVIAFECSLEDRNQVKIIEQKWNSGAYEEAIALLKNFDGIEEMALGITWKNPKTASSKKWAGDARIGLREDIQKVTYDIDDATGNLIAALLFLDSNAYYSFTINLSTDGGLTWQETYLWTASLSYEIDIDGVAYNDYFYLAYTYTNNLSGRIRRFDANNGTADMNFSPNGFMEVINEGVAIREVGLTSNSDHPTPDYLFYFTIMDNDSMRFLYSNSTVTTWYQPSVLNNVVDNASRGLDVCCSYPNKLWASYIGTDDILYCVNGWSSFNKISLASTILPNSGYVTSIGAYEDSVMILYPFKNGTDYEVRYRITTNGGNNWGLGVFKSNSTTPCFVNDITARGGDGFAMTAFTSGLNAEGIYRHRDYSSVVLSSAVSFADNTVRDRTKPCIQRIAKETYGILYVDWPEEKAYFDRSDWGTNINEPSSAYGCSLTARPNPFNDHVTITFMLPETGATTVTIYDLNGRIVNVLEDATLNKGEHALKWNTATVNTAARTGVYFCKIQTEKFSETIRLCLIQ